MYDSKYLTSKVIINTHDCAVFVLEWMLSGSCLESDTKWTHNKWVSAVNLGLLHWSAWPSVALWRRVCCYISIIWPSYKSNDHCSTAPLLLRLLLQRHHIRAGFGFHFPAINFNNTIIMIIYERMYSFAVSAWVCVDMCRIELVGMESKMMRSLLHAESFEASCSHS